MLYCPARSPQSLWLGRQSTRHELLVGHEQTSATPKARPAAIGSHALNLRAQRPRFSISCVKGQGSRLPLVSENSLSQLLKSLSAYSTLSRCSSPMYLAVSRLIARHSSTRRSEIFAQKLPRTLSTERKTAQLAAITPKES